MSALFYFIFVVFLIYVIFFKFLRMRRYFFKFGELSSFTKNKIDKGPIVHNYTEIYERFFSPLKYKPIKIVEIGIDKGNSLNLWKAYFPRAKIYAIDIIDASYLDSRRVKTFVADQASREQLNSFIREFGKAYDIIIDDGGHTMNQQQISLGFLFKYVKLGGYYIIEDVHTSFPKFCSGYGVARGGENSTFKMINNFCENGTFISKYLRDDEIDYLNNNISYINLYVRNNKRHSMASIIKKKSA